MAAFSPVAVEGLVLLTCVEWWKTAHSVVIRVDQAHLKHESRSRSRNSQLDPQGTPTTLPLAQLGRLFVSCSGTSLVARRCHGGIGVLPLDQRVRLWEILRKEDALKAIGNGEGNARFYYTPKDVNLSIETREGAGY